MSTKINTQPIDPAGLTRLMTLAIISSLAGWIVSGIIHEVGHALAILAFKGDITQFQPLVLVGAPHVSYTGNFSQTQQAIVSASGAGTVILIGLLVFMLFPFEPALDLLNIVLTCGFAPFLAQSLSFIILPILHLMGISIQDDVIQVLKNSHLHPLLVSFTACVFAVFGAWLVIRRTRFFASIQAIANLQGEKNDAQ
jgi:hypothetical protein